MADNTIVKNRNYAPFVDHEFNAAQADIEPGMALELDANGDVIKHSADPATDTKAPGRGLFADLSRSDPSLTRTDTYPSGEPVSVVSVPIGGIVEGELAAGGDLADSTRATVDPSSVLEQVAGGALAVHDGSADADTTATQTYYDVGALYAPLESVDNSGAAAGETADLKVVRIA